MAQKFLIVRKMPLDWGFSESIYLEESDIVSYSPTEASFCNICRYQTLTSRHLLTTSMDFCATTLNPYKSGLEWTFECLISTAENPLAVAKGPGSIAPLQAELWPFKEGNR